MYRQPKIIFLLAAAIAAVGSCSSALAASEYVVVAVDPPADSPQLGKLFRLGDLVHIEGGSTVTLMGDDGSVTALPGPADIVVTDDASDSGSTSNGAAGASSSLTAISDLLGNAAGQLQTIGGSRGVSDTTAATLEPWMVPVENGLTGCVYDLKLELWRPPEHRADVSVAYNEESLATSLVWDKDTPILAIPGNVPPDLRSVGLVIDDKSFRMPIVHLPTGFSPSDHVGLYAWMIGSGCLLQASALIRNLANR
ncbi:hypothetical protein [Mesorhizobium sp. M0207]|uniref:hypothetical protein n=1 Tax=Mesorhizobium sp. M0207 TaxID=2956915 RepID=UPI00333A365E